MPHATYRYVPQGPASLSSDAPGWSADANGAPPADASAEEGPVCWKCRGARALAPRRGRKKPRASAAAAGGGIEAPDASAANERSCPACAGGGRLPIRSARAESRSGGDGGGCVTARRRRPRGWREGGHVPPAVRACADADLAKDAEAKPGSTMEYALSILARANGSDDDYSRRNDVPVVSLSEEEPCLTNLNNRNTPAWLPVSKGEQLCNLVGKWRILQRVRSHRWTTDDLMTAFVAGSVFTDQFTREGDGAFANLDVGGGAGACANREIRYLDLGTGNGSVLQMVAWYLLSKLDAGERSLRAVGVEARSEAVGLARRSLAFNLGDCEYRAKVYVGVVVDASGTEMEPMKCDVKVVRGDFRDLVSLSAGERNLTESQSDTDEELKEVASRKYDLITGTPPYFRVDFSSEKESNGRIAAVINQGGMPTSMQSAPARCEFRGGVEAYCLAASALLAPKGTFVVCENWLNDHRVWSGAKSAGLIIDTVYPVLGKVGKPPLFGVYVMKKLGALKSELRKEEKVKDPVVVRDMDGKWTSGYAKIMDDMSIPVLESR